MRDAARHHVMLLVDVAVEHGDVLATAQHVDHLRAVARRPVPLRREIEQWPVREQDDARVLRLAVNIGGKPRDLLGADAAGRVRHVIERDEMHALVIERVVGLAEALLEGRARMKVFKEKIAKLKIQKIYLMPGEHDASLDEGKAFMEFFGKTHYTFDHKGVHFIVLDNVSDPRAQLGDEQLAWLAEDLKKQKKDQKIVVFTHRPLFDLYPQWDWATRDGAKAVDLLMPYSNVTVFYGHIHQENHHETGHIQHHAAKSLIFPLPAPGSQDKRTPLPWDAAMPFKGLGWRHIDMATIGAKMQIQEMPVKVAKT